jgi:hypothetical protein
LIRDLRKSKMRILFIEPKSPAEHVFSIARIPRLGSLLLATIMHGRGFGRVASQIVLFCLLCGACFLRPVAAVDDQSGTLLSLLTQIESSYTRINDYTAIFRYQARLDGKLLPEQTMLLKFQKPLKIYMKWIENPLKGTEGLYVEGKYDDKLIVHRGGMLGIVTLWLDPRGSVAMLGNRHPITEVGFGFVIDVMRRDIHTALQNREIEIIRIDDEPFNGRSATLLEARFAPQGGRKYYASRVVCHIDRELLLPIQAAFYDEKDVFFERFSYMDVKLNVGLTVLDFSRYNDVYRF